ncbi:microsomal glutathione S-transferase 3 [Folsomia candida]|uniref:Glutathione S-transferase 3, mitochondrial n=1 Tax=Folsomia candida TaxID=158441 RepID=A0A226E3L2_FOLCA|nr:microsomal glutathione S-transferase 3 [Folsomia candida]OXA52183.1 Microsomal glutathione S-transferase 3 [Folsomia candida]
MDFIFGGSALNKGANLVTVGIPREFGYVVLVAAASAIMIIWMGIQVGKARKKFKITYPTMYAPSDTKEGDHFNCYQRAHQNTLEGYPTFLFLLFLGGLEMPVFSALAGVVFILGRISYARGYYTGDPKNRLRGMYAMIGVLALLIATLKFGIRLICM